MEQEEASPLVTDASQMPAQLTDAGPGAATVAAKKKKGRRNRAQPPPAPRNTTQFLALQHTDRSPQHPEELYNYAAGSNSPPHSELGSDESLLGEDGRPAGDHTNTDFQKMYDECMYGDFRKLSKDQLLEHVQRQEREIEELRKQVHALHEQLLNT